MRLASLGLAAVAACVSCAVAVAQQPSATRTVYVTAVDGKQQPVADLTAADFTVKEDGKRRDVVSVERARAPMQIVLMLDDGGLGLASIRQGAGQFVEALQGRAEFAVITMGAQNQALVDFAADPRVVYAGLAKILPRNVPASHVLDGLLEAAQVLRRREAQRPVIVVVATEGADFSNARPQAVLEALERSAAQIYYIGLGVPVTQGNRPSYASERPHDSTEDEAASRNVVFGAAPKNSGGRSEQALQPTGVVALMKQFAADLSAQYAVTYRTEAAQGKLSIETMRKGVKVRAPARVDAR